MNIITFIYVLIIITFQLNKNISVLLVPHYFLLRNFSLSHIDSTWFVMAPVCDLGVLNTGYTHCLCWLRLAISEAHIYNSSHLRLWLSKTFRTRRAKLKYN